MRTLTAAIFILLVLLLGSSLDYSASLERENAALMDEVDALSAPVSCLDTDEAHRLAGLSAAP